MSKQCIFLVISVIALFLLVVPSGVYAADPEPAPEPEEESSVPVETAVFGETYRSERGMHLGIRESTRSVYQNVLFYVHHVGDYIVDLDGAQETVHSDGLRLFTFHFEENESHKLRFIIGSESFDYSFKIKAKITLSELEDYDIISLKQEDYDREKATAAIVGGLSTLGGAALAYRHVRNKKLNGVDEF